MAYTWLQQVDTSAVTATAGEALTKGAAVARNASDGYIYLANAKTGYDETRSPCIGFAFDAYDSGDTDVSVITEGRLEGASSLTPGQPVYLSETNGGITSTAPSDTGDIAQEVGMANTATQFDIRLGPALVA